MKEQPIIVTPAKKLNVGGETETIRILGVQRTEDAIVVTSSENGKQIVNTILVNEVKFLIDSAIQKIIPRLGFTVLVVDELPIAGEFGIIYLVAKEGSGTDEYDEYIWIVKEGEETGEWESLGSTSVDLSNYVTTNTDQTISGVKTFTSSLGLGSGKKLYIDANNNLQIDTNGYAVICRGTIRPHVSNLLELGNSNAKWKDFYLSGSLKDGTNSLSVADISNGLFNVINASDIVNNTLTQEQYDLITNGKPTLIKGTLLSQENIFIFPTYTSSGNVRATIISVDRNNNNRASVASILITGTQAPYGISISSNLLSINTLERINGKAIPDYPSDTTKQYKLVQQVGGTLAWVEDV